MNYGIQKFIIFIFLFFDVRLLSIYITGGKYWGNVLFLNFYLVLLCYGIFSIFKNKFPKEFWVLLLFLVISLVLNIVRGLGVKDVILMSIPIVFIPTFFDLYSSIMIGLQQVRKSILFATIVHIIIIIYTYINPEIQNLYTGYGEDLYLYTRATGAFPAPGLLSFFASISFVFGLSSFYRFRHKVDIAIILNSLFLGLMSGNRSFIIISLLAIITMAISGKLIITAIRKPSFLVALLLLMVLLVKVGNPIFIKQKDLIQERFKYEVLGKDIYTRVIGESGITHGIYSLYENPFLGNVVIDKPSGRAYVKHNNVLQTVNNGYISIISYNGVVLAIMFFYVVFTSIKKYYRVQANMSGANQSFLFKYVLLFGMIFCFSDAFLSSNIMLSLYLIPQINSVYKAT